MVIVKIDGRNCSRCCQPFKDWDEVDIDEECSEMGGVPGFLHIKCPDDAMFDVARAACVRCGKVHRLVGHPEGYKPGQSFTVNCCLGSSGVEVRVTGRYKEGEK